MTGLDVLVRCERYAGDMQRLKLSYDMAMDAAMRVSPRMDGNGGGKSAERTSAPERFAVKAEGLSRKMFARKSMYAMELEEAANLLERLPIAQAKVVNLRMIEGKTVKEIAIARDCTVDAARALLSRGRVALSSMPSSLESDWDYQDEERKYRQK